MEELGSNPATWMGFITGLAAAVVVLSKIIDRLPWVPAPRAADYTTILKEVFDPILLELKELNESHNAPWARRPDNTHRWHNREEVEQATLDNKKRLAQIMRIMENVFPEAYKSVVGGSG